MVHFVGAGPGAPDLITVRGKELLEKTDCIIYAGSLVNPALLDYAKEGCKVYNSAEMTLEQVIDVIVKECRLVREETGANQVALTGGTFQNKILMEGALKKLRALGFHPYYNISVSPNDGGIALGQAYIALQRQA